MNVAVIPARGGSKRIPDKNIKEFCGKPIIAYSIEAAREALVFDRVVVSTDSDRIAEIALDYGAEIPFMRPPELADDYTGTDAVVLHALQTMLRDGMEVKNVCCIYATAPFVKPEYLVKGLDLLEKENVAGVFSVTTFPYPILRALKMDGTGRMKMFWPEYRESRSQDLPEAYHDAGQFYWADAGKYLEAKTFFSGDAMPVILPRYLAIDIDTMEDWVSAELLCRYLMVSEVPGKGAGK